MSKRFGRNQKRKMEQALGKAQARVSALEFSEIMNRHLLSDLQEKIEHQRGILTQVARVLGKHFVGLDPEILRTNGIPEVVRIPMNDYSFCEAGDYLPSSQIAHDLVLQVKAIEVCSGQAWVDELRNLVHAEVRSSCGRVAYAIDRHTLSKMGREDGARFLGKEMAKFLVKELPA